ncbi:hypothetical protein QL996_02965 [Planococcus sp. APC 4015]|nr:hypothetical protein [Planococcus sp. APC 4015]
MAATDTYDNYNATTVPQVIARYMVAQGDGTDSTTIAQAFTSDAHVNDEGIDYNGEEGLRAWLNKTAGEFTYTTTLTGQRQDGPDKWTVIAHLEGDFPGGVVDLPFRFTLRGDKISKLIIAL